MQTLEAFARELEVISPPAPALPLIEKKSSVIGMETLLIWLVVGLTVAIVIYRSNNKRKENE
jgi:hypothetical protein